MEVLLEKSSPTLASLKVTLTPEDYRPKVDKSIKDYSKKVSLKGFRQGKVPTNVIERMYGKSILIDEVNHLLSHAVSDYIKENKLQIVGDPIPQTENVDTIEWNKDATYNFSYELGLATDFVIDFASIPAVDKLSINAGDKELDSTIENLKERFAQTIHPEIAEKGDMIFGELSQESTGFTTKTAIPTNKVKEDVLDKFVGVKKEDIITLDIQNTFEDEAAIAHVTGKKKEETAELAGEFTFKVEDINRQAPAEFNQEFFDNVFGEKTVETEEQFREKLMDVVKENYTRESENYLRLKAEQALLNNIEIELPDEFLKNWLEKSNEGNFTREKIEEQYEDIKKSIKYNLIRNRIAETFNLTVEYPEILEFTRNMVREQFGIYAQEGEMSEMIDKIALGYLRDQEKDNTTQIFNQLLDNKVFGVIKENIAQTDKAIEVEEFEALVKVENESRKMA